MVRVLGMVTAPGFNVVLKHIDVTFNIGSTMQVSITPLNGVGLFLAIGNLMAVFVMYFFLEEPDRDDKDEDEDADGEANGDKAGDGMKSTKKKESIWESFLCAEIFVPLLSSFTLNANFQLMETGMAPVASDALGEFCLYILLCACRNHCILVSEKLIFLLLLCCL